MKINDGGPAFPNVPSDPAYVTWDYGMSLLEYYAGQAFPALLHGCVLPTQEDRDKFLPLIAALAFEAADAMVAEAQKRKGGAA